MFKYELDIVFFYDSGFIVFFLLKITLKARISYTILLRYLFSPKLFLMAF